MRKTAAAPRPPPFAARAATGTLPCGDQRCRAKKGGSNADRHSESRMTSIPFMDCISFCIQDFDGPGPLSWALPQAKNDARPRHPARPTATRSAATAAAARMRVPRCRRARAQASDRAVRRPAERARTMIHNGVRQRRPTPWSSGSEQVARGSASKSTVSMPGGGATAPAAGRRRRRRSNVRRPAAAAPHQEQPRDAADPPGREDELPQKAGVDHWRACRRTPRSSARAARSPSPQSAPAGRSGEPSRARAMTRA